MNMIKPFGANCRMDPPKKYWDGAVEVVPIHIIRKLGAAGQTMHSFWRPTHEEILALKDGALVEVTFLGDSFPPTMVSVNSTTLEE